MKIRLKIADKSLTATLNDSEAARDFASLLPLRFGMNDLFEREKFAHLPRAISENAPRTFRYHVGDIAYWSPGGDVAIFYREGGPSIPSPGLILLGKLDTGVDALGASEAPEVAIERAE